MDDSDDDNNRYENLTEAEMGALGWGYLRGDLNAPIDSAADRNQSNIDRSFELAEGYLAALDRDPYAEGAANLQAQIDLAPGVYGSEAEFRPQYAQLDWDIYSDIMKQPGGVLDFYQRDLAPAQANINRYMNRRGRRADLTDVQRMGPDYVKAFEDANPRATGMLNFMTADANTHLAAGRDMTAAERREIDERTRGEWDARGMVRSDPAAYSNVLAQTQAGWDRQQQNRQYSQGVLAANQAVMQDPLQAVTGRPSTGITPGMPQAGNQFVTSGQGGPTQFDPFNQYGQQAASQQYGGNLQAGLSLYNTGFGGQQDVWNTLYNADVARDIGSQNASAGIFGGGLGALGTIGASLIEFCWVAREVYGEGNPEWKVFRHWLLSRSPTWFYRLYMKYGERFAAWIHDKPRIKYLVRNWMDARTANMRWARRRAYCGEIA